CRDEGLDHSPAIEPARESVRLREQVSLEPVAVWQAEPLPPLAWRSVDQSAESIDVECERVREHADGARGRPTPGYGHRAQDLRPLHQEAEQSRGRGADGQIEFPRAHGPVATVQPRHQTDLPRALAETALDQIVGDALE